MTWAAEDPQGDEAAKIKYLAVPYTRGIVLDMGCGPKKGFPHWLGVDSCKDTVLFRIPIKPDVVCDVSDPAAIANSFQLESVDAVFSSHCLEHIEDYKAALRAWWSLIKPGGHLVLYLPHADFYPRIGTEGSNPDHKHDFEPITIWFAMLDIAPSFDLLINEERNQDFEYSFYQVYKKTDDGIQATSYGLPSPVKRACVCRYGGFGDSIQASGILPQLKRQGFHVTFMTTPRGQEILQHDPHIDEWIIQDTDQVPNLELGLYWKAWAPRFERFVNLSESVESTLLAPPGRSNHGWPNAVRHRYMNVNYGEFTAELAQVPYRSEAKFYPTPEEVIKAKTLHGGGFCILWTLAGSSLHKVYRAQDNVIAQIMLELPQAHVIMVGDDFCRVLEQGWEAEGRVMCLSGKLGIRETLALALQADCVVGPETGVLNAVAFERMRKVVFLSHSSHQNLTKHWINTTALEAHEKTVCKMPCHRLHYSDEFCPTNEETRTAVCMDAIKPADVYGAIARAYETWRAKQLVAA